MSIVYVQILSFCDREIISNLTYDMQSNGARFLLGETIKNVEVIGVIDLQQSRRCFCVLTCERCVLLLLIDDGKASQGFLQ